MSVTLIDSALGELELRSTPFVMVGLQVSSRVTRPVARHRALANGGYDDTRFVGGRVATLTLVTNEVQCGDGSSASVQDLLDLILPFVSVERRPTLRWSLPGGEPRQMTVRGESAPIDFSQPRYLPLVISFVAEDGEITSPNVECLLIQPALDVELGRVYDFAPNRSYPPSGAIGDRSVTHLGNEPANWTATIFGGVVDPFLRVNGVTVSWTGLTVPAGSSIQIDTRERTMFLNGVAADNTYGLTNFQQWSFADLRLQPGVNRVRFGGQNLDAAAVMQMCWFSTWAG